MTEAELTGRLATWSLSPDGSVLETPSSWLLPVRQAGAAAMLKIFKPASDERDGAAFLRYLDGHGAVHVIAADDGGC